MGLREPSRIDRGKANKLDYGEETMRLIRRNP